MASMLSEATVFASDLQDQEAGVSGPSHELQLGTFG